MPSKRCSMVRAYGLLKEGDIVRIEMLDAEGCSIFGAYRTTGHAARGASPFARNS